MVFSSALFLYLFLPVVLLVYFVIPGGVRAKNIWLLIASYGFYAMGNVYYVPLLLGSTLVDYFCGLKLGRGVEKKRRLAWLWVSVITNVGCLFWFKYLGLFSGLFAEGSAFAEWMVGIALPVGISFYTFQSMSYTIDVYRGDVKPTRNIINFSTYVSLFPQLVAGPIVRYCDVEVSLRERDVDLGKLYLGVMFFVIGLTKKILLANPCGWIADQAFDAGTVDVVSAWIGVVAYGLQIYFDFSGYSEMAIGLGLMLGFSFPRNFNAPYHATSISDFWRRWHITLGTWLRDYVYIPLGGNRHGKMRAAFAVFVVMALAGFWHGAMWNFLLWGAIFGVLLIGEKILGLDKNVGEGWARGLRRLIVLGVVGLLWVLFRADSLEHAEQYYIGMIGGGGVNPALEVLLWRGEVLMYLLLGVFVCIFGVDIEKFSRRANWMRTCCVLVLMLVALLVLSEQSYNPFIYFRF